MHRITRTAALALLLALIAAGCGTSRRLEESIAAKDSVIARLREENRALREEAGRSSRRAEEMERKGIESAARAADLERELARVRAELEKRDAPVGKIDLRESYREALRLHLGGRHADAAAGFERLLAAGIGGDLADNCRYWIGESEFARGRYREAIARFTGVLGMEWSNKKDDAQVMIARSFAMLGDREEADQAYRRLLEDFPASPYADLARRRLGLR